jgi:predicted nuclease of predicted toxin-antitoxin system
VWLKTRGRDSEHLFDLNLLKATDSEIWQRAKAENLIIMSKDVDFYDRVLLLGPPPQVIHVSVGNCSNTRLLEILALEWDEIELALSSGSRLILNHSREIGSIRLTKLQWT